MRFLILLILILAGCAGVQSRIDEHRDEFTGYPPEVQMKLQNGEIEEGFSKTQVYIAKGNPDQTTERVSKGKTITTWLYGTKRPQEVKTGVPNSSDSLSGSFGYPEFGPRAAHHPAPHRSTPPRMEIEFENGRVKKWR